MKFTTFIFQKGETESHEKYNKKSKHWFHNSGHKLDPIFLHE